MFLLRTLPRRPLVAIRCSARTFITASIRWAPPAKAPSTASAPAPEVAPEEPKILSSCPEGTVLDGVQWLKGQPPVQALPDDAYPAWLWTILKPKILEDDGPGGKAEKVRLRMVNRQRIREQNFMKTQ